MVFPSTGEIAVAEKPIAVVPWIPEKILDRVGNRAGSFFWDYSFVGPLDRGRSAVSKAIPEASVGTVSKGAPEAWIGTAGNFEREWQSEAGRLSEGKFPKTGARHNSIGIRNHTGTTCEVNSNVADQASFGLLLKEGLFQAYSRIGEVKLNYLGITGQNSLNNKPEALAWSATFELTSQVVPVWFRIPMNCGRALFWGICLLIIGQLPTATLAQISGVPIQASALPLDTDFRQLSGCLRNCERPRSKGPNDNPKTTAIANRRSERFFRIQGQRDWLFGYPAISPWMERP